MKLRTLMSFWYYRDTAMEEHLDAFPERPEVFADSGAYSAKSFDSHVVLEEYAEWLHRWGGLFSAYANLDVIGDPIGSRRNLRALERRGLHPIPVFHGGEDFRVLRAYCKEYPYVALGGMAGDAKSISKDLLFNWLVKCFLIGREYGTKFHGFGQTQVWVCKSFPWYSLDSSSWFGVQYGSVHLWDDKACRFRSLLFSDHKDIYSKVQLLRDHGGDPALFATPGFNLTRRRGIEVGRAERAQALAVSVRAWQRFEEYLRRRHGEIEAPEGFDGTGLKIYLVDARGAGKVALEDAHLAVAQRVIETGTHQRQEVDSATP